ncbi:MAG: TolC family protein [Gemmatimonadota bacterium]
MSHRSLSAALICFALHMGTFGPPEPLAARQAAVDLTLEEAVARARDSSGALATLRYQVEENRRRSSAVFSNFLPRLETQAGYILTDNSQGIIIPSGSLGSFPELGGAFPPTDRTIPQGGTDLFLTMTTLQQPVTHFFQIRHAHRAAASDTDMAEARLGAGEQEVSLAALQLFNGLYLAREELAVVQSQWAASRAAVAMRESQVEAGTKADLALQEARVRALQARQRLLEVEDRIQDLNYQLTDLLAFPSHTEIQPAPPGPPDLSMEALEGYLRRAVASHPDILEAQGMESKARHGLAAARSAYIPEVGIIGAHVYQSSVPFFPTNTFAFGIQGKWTILDFGARGSVVGERRAQVGQSEENLAMVRARIQGEVETAYRKVERSREMVSLAREAAELMDEVARLRRLEGDAGYGLDATQLEAEAERLGALLELRQAEAGFRLAKAELEKAAGDLTQ